MRDAINLSEPQSKAIEELHLFFLFFFQQQAPVSNGGPCVPVDNVEQNGHTVVTVKQLFESFVADGFVIDPLEFARLADNLFYEVERHSLVQSALHQLTNIHLL